VAVGCRLLAVIFCSVHILEAIVQHTSCLAINGAVDGSATGDAGPVIHSSLCVEGFMVVAAVLMALCTDTGSHRRSDSKKSSLHIEQVIPVQLW
jgi:hypothetical protein